MRLWSYGLGFTLALGFGGGLAGGCSAAASKTAAGTAAGSGGQGGGRGVITGAGLGGGSGLSHADTPDGFGACTDVHRAGAAGSGGDADRAPAQLEHDWQ